MKNAKLLQQIEKLYRHMDQARASALRWGRMSMKDGAARQCHLDRVMRNSDQANAILSELREVLSQKNVLPKKRTLRPPLNPARFDELLSRHWRSPSVSLVEVIEVGHHHRAPPDDLGLEPDDVETLPTATLARPRN
jgi:hypothetical protein